MSKKIILLLILTLIMSITTSAIAQVNSGLHLVGSDGVYLGKLTTNEYDPDSVFNEYGDYGSEYSDTSIWNEFCPYGSDFSNKSAFNDFATEPPIIVYNGEAIGYLTKNEFKPNALDPKYLHSWLKENGF